MGLFVKPLTGSEPHYCVTCENGVPLREDGKCLRCGTAEAHENETLLGNVFCLPCTAKLTIQGARQCETCGGPVFYF